MGVNAMIEDYRARAEAMSRAAQQRQALAILKRPPLFDIEAASACNLRCGFCPRDEMRPRDRLMSIETWEAVHRFLPTDAVVMFSGLGEPLLNPRLEQAVAALKQRGISSCAITNGLLLSPERQRSLIDAGIDQFQVSLHSLDPDIWSEITGVGNGHAQVLANLEHLASRRPTGLRVQVNAVVEAGSESELAALEDWTRTRGMDIFVRRVHSRGGSMAVSCRAGSSSVCGILASVTFIASDGRLHACSNDVAAEMDVGDVRSLGWPEVRSWKRGWIAGNGGSEPCRGCNDDYRWAILAFGSVDVPKEASRKENIE